MIGRRPTLATVLAALTAVAFSAGAASATTWLVPGDGSNTCTTVSPSCDTVAQAVAASAPADQIVIGVGSFPVPTTLNLVHQLTISGFSAASTTLTPTGVAFDVQADDVSIGNLSIQGGTVGVRAQVPIDNLAITGVAFIGNSSRGLELAADPITNVAVTGGSFANPGTAGVRLASNSGVTGLSIAGTTFTGNRWGFYQANDGNTSTLTDLTIDSCTFSNNTDYGIYAEEMRDASIEDSIFSGGAHGMILFKFFASNGLQASNIAILRNSFGGFTGNALDLEIHQLGLGSPITVQDNTITKDVGIQTSAAAVFVRLHPTLANGAVNFVDNAISLTGTFGAGTAAHAVQLRGNGPVTFTGNVFDGGDVGGSGTTPPTSGIFVQSQSGSTNMPATTVITGSCNRIQHFENGVSIFDSSAPVGYGGLPVGAIVDFEDNAIVGNDVAGAANGVGSPEGAFENNWWGCPEGPGNPGCDAIIGSIDADPPAAAPPACVTCLVDAECDDGLFCTGAETCDVNGQCASAGDPCTGGSQCNDTCNDTADDCVSPDGTGCDDADECTATDVCTAGVCGGGTTCGDGTEQPTCGEVCDDGNTNSNDGCSATCQFEFVCTPAPLAGCRTAEPTKSSILVKFKDDLKDQVKWKWNRGAVTPKADFGNPTVDAEYRLCIYADGALVSRAHIPASGTCGTKPCWKEKSTGFTYKDKEATPDGITGLTLKEGLVAGKAKISVKGKGANLDTPPLPLAEPVVVQFRASTGVCWETTHSSPPQKNDGLQYKDKSD
jgi:cysteine-rich repeat protein